MSAHGELLFVYGTLRRGSGHRVNAVLEAAAGFVDRAVFRGRLYRVARYPGAVESRDPRELIVGDVFRLNAAASLLRRLDRYEGYDPGDPQTPYRRERRAVMLASGEIVAAWIYLYNRSTASLPVIASGDFLATLPGHGCPVPVR